MLALKIALIGSNPHTWEKVPELGPEWEVWRFSRRNFQKPPKFHRWFELHHPRNYPRYELSCHGYTKFLEEVHAITYRTFPFQKLLDEFGPYFFSGGQAPWILAYAISIIEPDTIGLWGINPRGDYKPQLSEVQHFAQIARDRGIEVIAPEDAVLENRPLYAIDKDYGHEDTMRALFLADTPRSQRLAEGQR
jgi:hypothetical protein